METGGETRDPVAPTDADALELEGCSRRCETLDRRRRRQEPCLSHGPDHTAVVPSARVAEEVDRDVEEPPELPPRARDLARELAGADGR